MAALQCEICGGKLIAKSGGLFECEYCGMQYDKTRIQEMVQEIKGTVKVEGTVQVQGTVAVDTKANRENLLKRIGICAKDRDFKKATALADELLKMDPECGEAYLWQVAANYKCAEIAELYRQLPEDLKKIRESAGWKNAMQYLEEGQAAAAKQQMEQAQQYWEKPDPMLKKRFDLVQPTRKMILTFAGALLALQPDGTVRVTYTPEKAWLAPVAQWTGVKRLFVSSIYGYVLALCWDGTILGVANRQSGQEIIDEVKRWETENEETLVDLVADDYIVAALFDDGELCCTKNHYDSIDRFVFGYACDWENVESLQIMYKTVKNLSGNFFGRSIFPNLSTAMILGLTRDGRILCSASCCNLDEVPRLEAALGIPRLESKVGVLKVDRNGNILFRDGTIDSIDVTHFTNNNQSWLDFHISDKGRILDFDTVFNKTYCERNLIAYTSLYAIRAEGTLLVAKRNGEDLKTSFDETDLINWKNIAMLREIDIDRCNGMLAIQDNGCVRLVWAGEAAEGINVDGWKLFDSLESIPEERENARRQGLLVAENRRKQKEAEERRKQEEAQRKQEHERKKRLDAQKIAQERRNAGLCQHCGGELKGLFFKKCVACGKPKDY